jgi:hypothetical protein
VPFSTEESIYLNCLGFLASGLPCINADGSVNILTPVITQGAAAVLPYQAQFSNFGENDIYSVFADFTYALNASVELTFGLRYVTEDKVSGYSSLSPNSVLSGGPLLPGLIPMAFDLKPKPTLMTGFRGLMCCIHLAIPPISMQQSLKAAEAKYLMFLPLSAKAGALWLTLHKCRPKLSGIMGRALRANCLSAK